MTPVILGRSPAAINAPVVGAFYFVHGIGTTGLVLGHCPWIPHFITTRLVDDVVCSMSWVGRSINHDTQSGQLRI